MGSSQEAVACLCLTYLWYRGKAQGRTKTKFAVEMEVLQTWMIAGPSRSRVRVGEVVEVEFRVTDIGKLSGSEHLSRYHAACF